MKQTGFSINRIAHVTKLFEARDAYVKKSGMRNGVKILKNKVEGVVGSVGKGDQVIYCLLFYHHHFLPFFDDALRILFCQPPKTETKSSEIVKNNNLHQGRRL